MPRKSQHVVPNNGRWGVRGAGNARLTKRFDTQREAIDYSREIARRQGAELVIHRPDNRIRDSDSHGRDPYPPKG